MLARRTLAAAALLTVVAAIAWAAEVWTVQVRRAHLRGQPMFLSPVLATLPLGSKVSLLASSGDWRQVKAAGRKGWLHFSCLTDRKLELRPAGGKAAGGASGEELTLAGKGFSPEAEAAFRRKGSRLNYRWVDWIEKSYRVSPGMLSVFLRQGGLKVRQVKAPTPPSRDDDEEPPGGA